MKTSLLFFKSILISLIILSSSCHYEKNVDQELFIPVEKSRLYVRLAGNEEGPLLVNLHGGPGAFSGFDHGFNKPHLENEYLVAYLDQRGGGKSDACADSSMLTMEQFGRRIGLLYSTCGD